MKKYTRAAVVMCLVLCFAALMSVFSFSAEVKLTDIDGHWAKEYIEYGIDKGYINGYTDNTFRPNKTVTRAEFSKMINSALKITGAEVSDFSDVADKDWFSSEVKHALYAGYIKGYEDNTFRPNNPISRQEAAVVLSRIVLPTSKRASLDVFKDKGEIADWAKDSIALIAQKGYMKGDQNGNVLPKGNLTRAEAAKLISELIKNENVVNGSQEIKKGQTISQSIFTDGLVISCEEDAEIFLADCRVFGDIEVESGMIVMSLGNTVADSITNNSEDSLTVMLDQLSNVSLLTVYHPMLIMGNGIDTVVLEGDDLQSGSVEFDGNAKTVDVNSSAIIKISDGKIENLNINKPVNCVVQSGSIKKFTVAKEAKGSVITLAQKVSIDSVVNNEAVSYYGTGEIKKAENLVDGVSYETAPKETVGKKPVVSEDKEDNNIESGVTVTFSPANGETKVETDTLITITFSEKMYAKGGDELTTAYVEDEFEVRKGSTAGTKINFDASVASTKKKITIAPASDLAEGTKYYVIIPAGTLENGDEEELSKQSIYFTTSSDEDEESDIKVTFSPENKETKVDTDTLITITFSEKMYAKGGDTLTTAYVEDEFELRKGSTSGSKVNFDAAVASTGKKVTIAPMSDLSAGTKYYVIIPAETLENGDEEELSKQSIYFTTASSSDDEDDSNIKVTITPENKETKVDVDELITVTFSEKMYTSSGKSLSSSYVEDAIELRKGSSSGTKVDFEVAIASTGKKLTLAPVKDLAEGTKYYIIIPSGSFVNGDDEPVSKTTSYFTTVGTANDDDDEYASDEFGISIIPADGSKNVVQMPSIELTFSEPIVRPNGKDVTKEYIEDYVVELRKSTKTGTKIAYTASVSTNSRKIVVLPNEELTAGSKYCIVIKADTVAGKDSDIENDEVLSYFTVATATTPTIIPASGTKSVSTGTSIVVNFGGDEIYDSSSSTERKLVDEDYIRDNEVITLYRNTTSGTEIPCDIEVNANTGKVTLTPRSALAANYRYYVVVKSSKIYNVNRKAFSSVTSYFDTNERMLPTFDPEDGDDEFPVDDPMTITFDEPVYSISGSKLSKSYLVDEVIRLYTGDSENEDMLVEDISVTISSDNKTITVTPDEDLDGNTEYTLVLVGGTIANDEDDRNAHQLVTFTTENSINKTIEITPANAATGVATNVNPVVYFKTKVLKDNGKEVDNKYATSSILLCEGSKSVSKSVGATVEVGDDGKTFTIIPDADLKTGTKYYIWIQAGCFLYNDKETEVATKSTYFTTTKTMPEITALDVDSSDEYSVTLDYTSVSTGRIYFELESADGEHKLEKSQGCSEGTGTITITGLNSGTRYNVIAYVILSGIESDRVEIAFDTKEEVLECTICGGNHKTANCDVECEVCGEKHLTANCDVECEICGEKHLTANCDVECEICGEKHLTANCDVECEICGEKHLTENCDVECEICGEKHLTENCDVECEICGEKHLTANCDVECEICGEKHLTENCDVECEICRGKHLTANCDVESGAGGEA